MDSDIEQIYLQENKYYIEFDGKRRFLCLFPREEELKNESFKTLEEALNYMLVINLVKEVTIRN